MTEYLLYKNEEMKGPFTPEQLLLMSSNGEITTDTLCSRDGVSDWIPFSALVRELPQIAKVSEKRILLALMLLLLSGFIGAHAFYAGRNKQGSFYLLTCATFILFRVIPYRSFSNVAQLVIDGLAVLFCFNFLLLFGDFIHLVLKDYKDGHGNKITRWA